MRLTGEGGLLGKLTKIVVEGALESELDDHLGYARYDPAGRGWQEFPQWPSGQDRAHRGWVGADGGFIAAHRVRGDDQRPDQPVLVTQLRDKRGLAR